jgi:hypothetical protein
MERTDLNIIVIILNSAARIGLQKSLNHADADDYIVRVNL